MTTTIARTSAGDALIQDYVKGDRASNLFLHVVDAYVLARELSALRQAVARREAWTEELRQVAARFADKSDWREAFIITMVEHLPRAGRCLRGYSHSGARRIVHPDAPAGVSTCVAGCGRFVLRGVGQWWVF